MSPSREFYDWVWPLIIQNISKTWGPESTQSKDIISQEYRTPAESSLGLLQTYQVYRMLIAVPWQSGNQTKVMEWWAVDMVSVYPTREKTAAYYAAYLPQLQCRQNHWFRNLLNSLSRKWRVTGVRHILGSENKDSMGLVSQNRYYISQYKLLHKNLEHWGQRDELRA